MPSELIEAAVRDGRITRAERDVWLQQYKAAPKATAKLLESLAPGCPPRARAPEPPVEGTGWFPQIAEQGRTDPSAAVAAAAAGTGWFEDELAERGRPGSVALPEGTGWFA